MTRREFIKAFLFSGLLIFFFEDLSAENSKEELREAMFWRMVEDE